MLAKAMAVAPAAFSLYNMGSTILDAGDVGDALAMNVTAAAGMKASSFRKFSRGYVFWYLYGA